MGQPYGETTHSKHDPTVKINIRKTLEPEL